MSAVRDKAREIIDGALPSSTTVITSNGATAAKYAEMTGLTHKRLTDNWAGGGIMTGCNGFTGWYGTKLGSKTYLGGFDLEGIVKKAGKPQAWVLSTAGNRPQYGDILRHASFHVDVALDFEGERLWRAAGGQGGKKAGCDMIKRVKGATDYDPKKIVGWIDIDLYFGEAGAQQGIAVPDWMLGWWQITEGQSIYYYYFFRSGIVQFTSNDALVGKCPYLGDDVSGRFSIDIGRNIVIAWNDSSYAREGFAPADDATPPALKGRFLDGAARAPLQAKKIAP